MGLGRASHSCTSNVYPYYAYSNIVTFYRWPLHVYWTLVVHQLQTRDVASFVWRKSTHCIIRILISLELDWKREVRNDQSCLQWENLYPALDCNRLMIVMILFISFLFSFFHISANVFTSTNNVKKHVNVGKCRWMYRFLLLIFFYHTRF